MNARSPTGSDRISLDRIMITNVLGLAIDGVEYIKRHTSASFGRNTWTRSASWHRSMYSDSC